MTRDHIRSLVSIPVLTLILGVAPTWAFQRDGSYVYKADGQVLGTEQFSTKDTADGYQITSRTELDLDAYLLHQTSLMEVGFDHALFQLQVAGNSGGKAFGFDARVLGSSLYFQDMVSGEETVLDYDQPFYWIVGNFMQHLIFAFASYDRAAGGPQEIPTQAGPLSVELVATTGLHGPTATVEVEHYRLVFMDGAMDLYADLMGRVDRIDLDGQPVSIFRSGFEDWTVAPLDAGTATGTGGGLTGTQTLEVAN